MTTMRRSGAVSVTALVGLSLSLAAAHTLAPEWSRRAGLDVWNLPSLQKEYRQADEDRAEVEAFGDRAAKRREIADHITRKLANGMPLAAATEELMELYQDDQGMLTTLESLYRVAPTARHRFALHAIERTQRLFRDDPERWKAVSARLHAEYKVFDASPESPHSR